MVGKLTKRYREAKETAHYLALQQTSRPMPRFPTESVRCHFDFFLPDRRRRDVPNLFKLLYDSLEGVVYTDDHQATGAGSWLVQGVDKDSPRVEITVEAI
jgi:Holliday junction resolvase RusA-like endonuclease